MYTTWRLASRGRVGWRNRRTGRNRHRSCDSGRPAHKQVASSWSVDTTGDISVAPLLQPNRTYELKRGRYCTGRPVGDEVSSGYRCMIPLVSSILGFPEEKGTVRVSPEPDARLFPAEASGGHGWEGPSCTTATLVEETDIDSYVDFSSLEAGGGQKKITELWKRCGDDRHYIAAGFFYFHPLQLI